MENNSFVKYGALKRTVIFAILTILLSAVSMPVLAGLCKNAETKVKTVRVGFFEAEGMLFGAQEGKKKSGYCFDYLMHISSYTGWNYEFVYGTYAELYEKLKNGEIDILPYTNKNAEREREVLYSDCVLAEEEYYVVSNPKNPAISGGIKMLNGQTISVVSGYDSNLHLEDFINRNNLNVDLKYYSTIGGAWEALRKGDVDATVYMSNAFGHDEWQSICQFGVAATHICVAKDKPELLEELNIATHLIDEQNPSLTRNLYKKYFNDNPVRKNLTSDEREWIKSHPVIHVGCFANDAPYIDSYDKKTRTATGLIVDVVNGIIERLNLDVKADFRCYDSVDEMENALANGEIEVFAPFYPEYNMALDNGLILSTLIRMSNMELVYKNSTVPSDALANIATPSSRLDILYVRDNYPNAEVIGAENIQDAVDCVRSGKAKGAIAQNIAIHAIASKYDNLSTLVLPTGSGACFASRLDNYLLIRILNRGLLFFSSSEILSIASKHRPEMHIAARAFLAEHKETVVIVAIIIILLLIAGLITLSRLKDKSDLELEKSRILNQTITEQKTSLEKTYAELREANLRDELLYDIANAAKWTYKIDDAGEILAAQNSDIAHDLLDVNQSKEPMGWTELLHLEDKEKTITAFMAAIRDRSGRTPYEVTYRLVNNDGNYRWIKASGRVLSHDNGNREFLGVSVDITGQIEKEHEQQQLLQDAFQTAESANRSKTNFLFNMSHDIRTPMNAITGFTTMAKKNLDDKTKVADYLEKIDLSSQQLLMLINQVLEMSRIESGKVEFNEEPVNIKDEYEMLVTILSEQAQVSGLEFHHSLLDVTHFHVYADTTRMSQITLNITSNALKYTPRGGSVNYVLKENKCERKGYASFTFTVEDTGIGMSKEYLEHLYEPFSRERNTTVSKIQGTGLGTSIVKSIVDMMGGTIKVQSEPGKGTRFDVTVELRVDENISLDSVNQKSSFGSQPSDHPFKGRRALLVEDNELNREIAKFMIEDLGLIVEEAEDGLDAVNKVKASKPGYYDCIFMDIQMPVMDGYQATKEIRAYEASRPTCYAGGSLSSAGSSSPHIPAHIPIIALSANAFAEDKQKSQVVGMDDHIAKPINEAELMAAVVKYLK